MPICVEIELKIACLKKSFEILFEDRHRWLYGRHYLVDRQKEKKRKVKHGRFRLCRGRCWSEGSNKNRFKKKNPFSFTFFPFQFYSYRRIVSCIEKRLVFGRMANDRGWWSKWTETEEATQTQKTDLSDNLVFELYFIILRLEEFDSFHHFHHFRFTCFSSILLLLL